MKTLIIFYSYTNHTKKLAKELAGKESADIMEIKDKKRPGKLKAYSFGCFAAMRGKPWPIQNLDKDLKLYDRLILLSPVWAGNPPPFVYALLENLPGGKTISVKMVSASGKSNCRERLNEYIKSKGSTFESFEDIKA